MLDYKAFLKEIIEDGIKLVTIVYENPEDNVKLQGALRGYEVCRDKTPNELREIWEEIKGYANKSEIIDEEKWWFKTYEWEVEWVCNVVSALISKHYEPILPWLPTSNGELKAKEIINKYE